MDYTMKLMMALAIVSLASATSPTPAPCPATPANYCVCGSGDSHGYKYYCRSNDGYTWSTNDAKPVSPCPCKYSECTVLTTEALVDRVSGAALDICDPTGYVHSIATDGADKGNCVELAFPGGPLASKFWEAMSWKYSAPIAPQWSTGKCNASFDKVSTETPYDGWTEEKNGGCGPVSLSKYAPASASASLFMMAAEVTPLQEDTFHGISGPQCRESNVSVAGIDQVGQCPVQYDVREGEKSSIVCRTGGNLKYCKKEDIVTMVVTTWGETGWKHAIQNNHCVEANFTIPGVNESGLCDKAHYPNVQSDETSVICRTGGNVKYCDARDVIVVEVVTRGD